MADETTMLSDLIVPEVMADMISAKLPTKLLFAPLAVIDDKLVGTPGNKIIVPKYEYIGDAEEIAEGARMGTAKLQTGTAEFTIKKIGKAVEITDESVLSGYGDPAGEAERQILMAIASKIDADCADEIQKSKLIQDESANIISYDGVVNATDLFNEEEQSRKVIFVHSKQLTQIRKDRDFLDKNKYPMDLMMTGAIGMISGCEVVPSNRVKCVGGIYYNPIVKQSQTNDTEVETPALKIFRKRGVLAESTRDALASKTIPSATQHYGVALTNESKVVIVKFAAGPKPILGELSVTSVEGTTVGNTIISVSPEKASANSYKVKMAASPTLPAAGAICTTGYTVWDGNAELTATAGHKVVVVEVSAENRAVAAGIAVLVVKA